MKLNESSVIVKNVLERVSRLNEYGKVQRLNQFDALLIPFLSSMSFVKKNIYNFRSNVSKI